jgi:hypothetical protein
MLRLKSVLACAVGHGRTHFLVFWCAVNAARLVFGNTVDETATALLPKNLPRIAPD